MPNHTGLVIDGTPLDTSHRFRGIGSYATYLISALRRSNTPSFRVLRLNGDDTETVKIWRPSRNSYRLQWFLNRALLPHELRLAGTRFYHALDPMRTAPIAGIRRITTLYDLIPLVFSRQYLDPLPIFARKGYAWMLSMMQSSDYLIAISKYSKAEFIRLIGYESSRIFVVPLGYDPKRFNIDEAPDEVAQLRAEHGQFIVYTGSLQPHKNLPVVLEALSYLPRSLNFVLTGPSTLEERRELAQTAERLGVGRQVRHLGFVAGERLPQLYRAALAFVLPSLLEGFGLPLLDAMACGTPVVASRSASLPEVGGEAALYFDPLVAEELAEHLGQLLENIKLRAHQIERGREQVKRFSWERTAHETAAIYRKVLIDP